MTVAQPRSSVSHVSSVQRIWKRWTPANREGHSVLGATGRQHTYERCPLQSTCQGSRVHSAAGAIRPTHGDTESQAPQHRMDCTVYLLRTKQAHPWFENYCDGLPSGWHGVGVVAPGAFLCRSTYPLSHGWPCTRAQRYGRRTHP